MIEKGHTRQITSIAIGGGLLLGFVLLRAYTWQGNTQLHTLMEVLATALALFVGVVALVRLYTQRNSTFLFVGTGFLGTALLDGYHAIATSSFFDHVLPSVPSSLIPWSWVASRFFLSLMLFLSWWAWQKEGELGEARWFSNRTVQSIAVGLTLFSPGKTARGVKSPAYQIHIEDNGIGFDEKYLDRIFKPFQRLHGRNTYEGSGIGLAICHKIAERHGGAITATSTPGQGATFTITLNKNPGEGGIL